MAMDINEPRHSRLPVGIQNPLRRLSAVLFSVGKYNGIPLDPDAAEIWLRACAVYDLRVFNMKIRYEF